MSSFRQPSFLSPDDEPRNRVRCPVHGFIHYSDRERQIIGSKLFSADGSNPAISGHRKTGHFWRPETGVEFYLIGSCVRKVVWTLVRQLRGPHLSTCA